MTKTEIANFSGPSIASLITKLISLVNNFTNIWNLHDSVPANTTTYQDTGLAANTTYYYRAYAIVGNTVKYGVVKMARF